MTTKERIISTYHQLDSIKETSRVLRISEQSVRRILVNAGEYSNSRSQEIADLVAEEDLVRFRKIAVVADAVDLDPSSDNSILLDIQVKDVYTSVAL